MKDFILDTAPVVFVVVLFWTAFGVGSFKAGEWTEMERQITNTDSLRTELSNSNAKFDRLESWVKGCKITYVAHSETAKVKTFNGVCPDSIEIEVEK